MTENINTLSSAGADVKGLKNRRPRSRTVQCAPEYSLDPVAPLCAAHTSPGSATM